MNDSYKDKDIYTITPFLRQLGISSIDSVISIPDASNATLYLMNVKGWTEYTDAHFNKGNKIYYNRDSSGIQASIDKGAKYLILGGIEELYKKPYLQSFCKSLIGQYKDVLVFNLKSGKENFNLANRQIKKKIECSAELTTDDKQFFINDQDSSLFENGTSQSDAYSYTGMFSCRLNAEIPYGMTKKITNPQYGQSFEVSVWRKKSNNSKSGLIVSVGHFYKSASKIIEVDPIGWEKLFIDFFITSEMANQELKIYLYNPEAEPTYFDDLEIVEHESVFNNSNNPKLKF